MTKTLLFFTLLFIFTSCGNNSPKISTEGEDFCQTIHKMSKIPKGQIYEIPAKGLDALGLNEVSEAWGLEHLAHLDAFKHYFGPREEHIPEGTTRLVYFHSYIGTSPKGNCIAILGTTFIIDADEEALVWVEFDSNNKAIYAFEIARAISVGAEGSKTSSILKENFTIEKTTINTFPEESEEKIIETFVNKNGVFEKAS